MDPTTLQPDVIYSELGADPDMGELVEMYVDEIPDRISTLRQAHASGDAALLQRTAHQIKGASGSYGFTQLTPFAAKLEYAVRDGEPEERIVQALDALVAMCGKLRAGTPD